MLSDMNEDVFESEVRRICSQLWRGDQDPGASHVDGRERDLVYHTPDAIHVVECTVSKRKEKAAGDGLKTDVLVRSLRMKFPDRVVQGWFITLADPTADQREAVDEFNGTVKAISFHQLQSRLVNSREYVSLRKRHRFGSVRDPDTGHIDDATDYIDLDLYEPVSGHTYSTKQLSRLCANNARIVLLGDFGAGKSMTVRELFRRMSGDFLTGRQGKFPVCINLNEHPGETDPSVALYRHARLVGFAPEDSLVRAWKCGFCHILLDGFDELSTAKWAGRMHEFGAIKRQAMTLVRRFVEETPADVSIVISGRTHFFEGDNELRNSLGLSSDILILNLTEFSDQQIARALKRKGLDEQIPEWFPTRPLFLGYLISRGFMAELGTIPADMTPSAGWAMLFGRMCDREARAELGFDASHIRALLARMATRCRRTGDGLGPLLPSEMIQVCTEVCGFEPEPSMVTALQRLPGLGVDDTELQSRRFVDAELADVARAGDVVECATNPYGDLSNLQMSDWNHPLREIGIAVVAESLTQRGTTEKQLSACIHTLSSDPDAATLCLELAIAGAQLGLGYSNGELVLSGGLIAALDISDASGDLSRLTLRECWISVLAASSGEVLTRCPQLQGCVIERVDGLASPNDAPTGLLDDEVEIGEFTNDARTTAAILDLGMPMGSRVLLTILKKLYLQTGKGRKESALWRGLDHVARTKVQDTLDILRSEGLAESTRLGSQRIWLPTRSGRARALKILAEPTSSNDMSILRASKV